MREVIDLGDDFVQAINFLDYDLIELFAKIGVVETLGEKLSESFYSHERIADFVRHARGEVGPKCGSIDQRLLLTQRFLRGEIVDDRHCAEGHPVVGKLARFYRNLSAR